MAAFGISGLVLALLLWSVGLFAVLPPTLMGALFGLAALSGLRALLPFRRRAPASGRRIGAAAGTFALASLAVYLAVLFGVGGGRVPVERRVAAPQAPIARLRLVDFNVLHGYPRFVQQEERYRLLLAAFRALEPTVIVVQESWSIVGHGHLAERLGADLGLDVAYARANGSRRLLGFEEGSAVLSRLPIVEARRIVLSPRRPFWESRVALVVRVQVGPAETVPIAGTHLTYLDPAVAADQARHLAGAALPEDTLAVAGDLNLTSGSDGVAAFEERGFVDVVPGGIDHVLVNERGGWRVESAERTLRPRDLGELIGEAADISDHSGIVVDLVRRAEESPGVSTAGLAGAQSRIRSQLLEVTGSFGGVCAPRQTSDWLQECRARARSPRIEGRGRGRARGGHRSARSPEGAGRRTQRRGDAPGRALVAPGGGRRAPEESVRRGGGDCRVSREGAGDDRRRPPPAIRRPAGRDRRSPSASGGLRRGSRPAPVGGRCRGCGGSCLRGSRAQCIERR